MCRGTITVRVTKGTPLLCRVYKGTITVLGVLLLCGTWGGTKNALLLCKAILLYGEL